MAKGKSTKAAEPEESNDEETGFAIAEKSPGELHEAFVEWVDNEIGEEIDARAVQLAWGLRTAWRKTEGYQEAFGKDARAERRAAAEAEKASKAKAKAAESDDDEDEKPKATKATKASTRGKGKASDALAEANDAAGTTTVKTSKARGKGKAKVEAPF